MAPIGIGLKREHRIAEICADCKRRIQEGAMKVAPLVPYMDEKIQEALAHRLLPDAPPWTLDETLNVPYCNDQDSIENDEDDDLPTNCSECAPYLRHCGAAYAGFSDVEAYGAHLAYLRDEAAKKQAKVPVIIVDDNMCSAEERNNFRSDEAVACAPQVYESRIPDQGLIDHMRLVSQLQSIRGRKVINRFLHTDPTAIACLQGAVAVLEQREALAKTSIEQAKARVLVLQEALRSETQELHQLRTAVESIEDARPRKIPIGLVSDAAPKSTPTPATLPSQLSILEILDANPPITTQTLAQLVHFREMLRASKPPGYSEPPEAYAKWLQFHENQSIKGVPIHGPDWVVNLRDVRGRNAVLSRVPPGSSGPYEKRRHHADCLFAVLRVLAIPGAYASILQRTGTAVAREPDLSCRFAPPSPQFSPPNEVDVVQHLAGQGLTVKVADDAWQFCHKFLEAHASASESIFGPNAVKELLKRVNEKVRAVGRPAGLHPPALDRLPRTGLPDKKLERLGSGGDGNGRGGGSNGGNGCGNGRGRSNGGNDRGGGGKYGRNGGRTSWSYGRGG